MGKGKARWKEGYAEPLKLKWYDRVIANLIRIREQGDNIERLSLTAEEIGILNKDGKIYIFSECSDPFEANEYIYSSLMFDNVQDAIEFNWERYDKDRPIYMS